MQRTILFPAMLLVAANYVCAHVYLTQPTSRAVFAWSQYVPKLCSEAKGMVVSRRCAPMDVAMGIGCSCPMTDTQT